MANKHSAVVKQDGDWWIGWIEEVTATREELIESFRVTLGEELSFDR